MAPAAAAPTIPVDAPHWQVAFRAEPGQVFTATTIRGVTTTVTADARGVVTPQSVDQLRLVDRLPLASPDLLAAPVPDALPTEPTDDAGDDAEQED